MAATVPLWRSCHATAGTGNCGSVAKAAKDVLLQRRTRRTCLHGCRNPFPSSHALQRNRTLNKRNNSRSNEASGIDCGNRASEARRTAACRSGRACTVAGIHATQPSLSPPPPTQMQSNDARTELDPLWETGEVSQAGCMDADNRA